MSRDDLVLIARFADFIGIGVYQDHLGDFRRKINDAVWDPVLEPSDAFSLMSRGYMEMQYLLGKEEAHITSDCGTISFKQPFGIDVELTTQQLILKMALELAKRKCNGKR